MPDPCTNVGINNNEITVMTRYEDFRKSYGLGQPFEVYIAPYLGERMMINPKYVTYFFERP